MARVPTKRGQVAESAEARLNHLLASGSVVLHSMEPRAPYGATYVSENIVEMVGFGPEQFLEQGFWASRVHPQDKGAFDEHALVLEHGTHGRDYRFRCRDGTYRWIHDELRLIRDEAGNPREIIGHSVDISERRDAEEKLRRSEARLRQIAETAREVFWIIDRAKGAHVYASPAFETVFGQPCPAAGDPLSAWFDRVHPDDRAAVWEALCKSEGQGSDVEYRTLPPDGGEPGWIRSRTYAMPGAAGSETHWLVIARDITLERAIEEELQRTRIDLAHAARLSTMGEMVAAIAHELNQPLVAIAHYAEACRRMLVSDEWRLEPVLEHLESLGEQAVRAGDIIRRVRGFAAKDAGEKSEIDLASLIEKIVPLLEPESKREGVRLEYRLDPGLPPVAGDPIQIQQVVVNLVRNSIEAVAPLEMNDRYVVIETAPAQGGMVRVNVRDAGKALTQEDLALIFEPFFTTKEEGLGLGLSISRTLIETHGGVLDAVRTSGGTTFYFTLPVSSLAEAEGAVESLDGAGDSPTGPGGF